ncbi:MAG: glycosyltransferase family 2 protein [bacterium]
MKSEDSHELNRTNHPLVSVIVLNYNGRKFLEACFRSLVKTSYPNFEIILLDNNSTDDSVFYTKQNYKQVKIIQTDYNGGYSRAYNISFEKANGKYFVLLNNDVKVEPNWLEFLVKAAEADEKIGALQPKILSMIDAGYFEYAGASGGFMDKYGYPYLRGRVFNTIEKDHGQYDDEVEVFWTSGAAMFLRAEALQKSNVLDEDFVHHMEEIDLCWRLHLVGYKLKVIPSAKIYHYAGATIKPDSFMKIYWNFRNSVFMLFKNLGRKNLVKILFIRYLLDLLALLISLIKFDFKTFYAIVKAYWWLVFHIKLVFKKRKDAQNRRVVSDNEIKKFLYPKSIVIEYFLKGKKTYSELVKAC